MMAKKLHPDKWLFAATIGLALFGVVMVYSASAVHGAARESTASFYYVIKQANLDRDRVRRDAGGDAV